jgi:hypothetical protein
VRVPVGFPDGDSEDSTFAIADPFAHTDSKALPKISPSLVVDSKFVCRCRRGSWIGRSHADLKSGCFAKIRNGLFGLRIDQTFARLFVFSGPMKIHGLAERARHVPLPEMPCRCVQLFYDLGGRGGIRTHGALAGTPVFKTGALNHSATLPNHCCLAIDAWGQNSLSAAASLPNAPGAPVYGSPQCFVNARGPLG